MVVVSTECTPPPWYALLSLPKPMAQSNRQSWDRTLGPSDPSNHQGFVLTLEPEDSLSALVS